MGMGDIDMIKVCANLSKKVPLPAVDFSSQQFGASLEIEVSDGEKSEVLKAKLHELYTLLAQSVDEQIAKARGDARGANVQARERMDRLRWNGKEGTRTQRGIAMATQAQQRAIVRICEAQGLDVQAILADANAASPSQLTIKQASHFIDQLKARRM